MDDLIKREDAIQAVVDTEGIKGFDYITVMERLEAIPAVETKGVDND